VMLSAGGVLEILFSLALFAMYITEPVV
jgi:hypothetical protein